MFYLARYAREAHQHQLIWLSRRPPTIHILTDLLTLILRKHQTSSEDSLPLWVKFEHKFGDDAEVGATTADAPEQV